MMGKKISYIILPALLLLGILVLVYCGTYSYILLFAFISVISLLFSRLVYGTFFSPAGIMGVTWLLPSLLTFARPKWALSEVTFLVITISFFTFFIGCLLSIIIFNFSRRKNLNHISISVWNKHFLDLVIIIFFILGMASFAINLSRIFLVGGFNFYIDNGFRAAEAIFGQNTAINYIYFLNMLVVPLSVFRISCYKKNSLFIFIAIASFLTLFFHGIKSTILYSAVIVLWVIILRTNKIKIRYILILFSLIFTSFLFVTLGRNSNTFLNNKTLDLAPIIENIYNYAAPNYANLQQELILRRDYSLGVVTLSPILRILSFDKGNEQINLYLIDEAYNIGTYLRDFVIDFGLWGIIIFPFLIGFLVNIIFINFLKNPSQGNLFIYGIVATMITFSFWSNEFLRIQFLYFMVIIFFLELLERSIYKKQLTKNVKR